MRHPMYPNIKPTWYYGKQPRYPEYYDPSRAMVDMTKTVTMGAITIGMVGTLGAVTLGAFGLFGK